MVTKRENKKENISNHNFNSNGNFSSKSSIGDHSINNLGVEVDLLFYNSGHTNSFEVNWVEVEVDQKKFDVLATLAAFSAFPKDIRLKE